MGSQAQPSIPVIDFTNENIEPKTSSWLSTSGKVKNALEEYGCFVANYDSISSGLGESVFHELKELFNLPKEIKIKNSLGLAYGYVWDEPCAPLKESLRIGKIANLEGIQGFTNTIWPSGNQQFCEVVHSYSKLSAELEQIVIKMVFESYGAEKQFEPHTKATNHHLAVIKYRAPEINEINVGSFIHTDNGFVTIIYQNQVNGLQVQTKQGEWIDVDCSHPISFIVMAGDGFLVWSNGRIHSPLHRVIMKESETRYTLVQFSMLSGIVQTPEELVDDEHPLQFKPFDHSVLAHFSLKDKFQESGSVAKANAYFGL